MDEVDEVADTFELLRNRREVGESKGPDSLLVDI